MPRRKPVPQLDEEAVRVALSALLEVFARSGRGRRTRREDGLLRQVGVMVLGELGPQIRDAYIDQAVLALRDVFKKGLAAWDEAEESRTALQRLGFVPFHPSGKPWDLDSRRDEDDYEEKGPLIRACEAIATVSAQIVSQLTTRYQWFRPGDLKPVKARALQQRHIDASRRPKVAGLDEVFRAAKSLVLSPKAIPPWSTFEEILDERFAIPEPRPKLKRSTRVDSAGTSKTRRSRR
jgi:hypothetical protein